MSSRRQEAMERFQETLYDVLGVGRDANMHDIGRAWNRYRASMRAETTPPDPRRDALMRHAYETLSDEYKRAAYDASLRRGSPVLRATRRSPRLVAAIVVAFLAAAGAAAYLLHGQPRARVAPVAMKPVAEIATSLERGVGRVKLVDLEGHEAFLGIAVAFEEGVMATACTGLSPTAQPVVVTPAHAWPARVSGNDASGICRLEVAGGAGYPLPLTGEPPRLGATVYTVDVSPTGATRLHPGQVTRVGGRQGRSLEASVGVDAATDGRPLLDADGRLAAIGIVDDSGAGRYVPVPRQWLPYEAPAEDSKPRVPRDRDAAQEGGRAPIPISPEREKRLNETFRPPPKVPDEL